ncbi:unnamed protein product [Rhodiola kirilowii]
MQVRLAPYDFTNLRNANGRISVGEHPSTAPENFQVDLSASVFHGV